MVVRIMNETFIKIITLFEIIVIILCLYLSFIETQFLYFIIAIMTFYSSVWRLEYYKANKGLIKDGWKMWIMWRYTSLWYEFMWNMFQNEIIGWIKVDKTNFKTINIVPKGIVKEHLINMKKRYSQNAISSTLCIIIMEHRRLLELEDLKNNIDNGSKWV